MSRLGPLFFRTVPVYKHDKQGKVEHIFFGTENHHLCTQQDVYRKHILLK